MKKYKVTVEYEIFRREDDFEFEEVAESLLNFWVGYFNTKSGSILVAVELEEA